MSILAAIVGPKGHMFSLGPFPSEEAATAHKKHRKYRQGLKDMWVVPLHHPLIRQEEIDSLAADYSAWCAASVALTTEEEDGRAREWHDVREGAVALLHRAAAVLGLP